MDNIALNFEPNLELQKNPLIEAWLEVRWELEINKETGIPYDPAYQYTLGAMYSLIKDKYPYKESLPSNQVPEAISPYQVRQRFRAEKDKGPLIQIGPGVATVNILSEYSWARFIEEIEYLRNAIVQAYDGYALTPGGIAIRYKNAFPFQFSENDSKIYLENKLNTIVEFPNGVPGDATDKQIFKSFNQKTVFDLEKINCIGVIDINTGKGKDLEIQNKKDALIELFLLQLEIHATKDHTPEFEQEDFFNWANSAHSILHEWFFSFIDGDLVAAFREG